MNGLNKKVVGLSLATASAIVYMICVLAYWIAPNTLIVYGNYLFHSVDLGSIAVKSVTFIDALIGLVLIFVSGYLIGLLFAGLYNYFIKKY